MAGVTTALLHGGQKRRRSCNRFCPRSKAAVLLLVWNLIVVTCLDSFLDPSEYAFKVGSDPRYTTLVVGTTYGISALMLIFYPLAGCLADIRWGRNKAVVNSLNFMFWSVLIMAVLLGTAVMSFIPVIQHSLANNGSLNVVHKTTVALTTVIITPAMLAGIVLIICSVIVFKANIIQFGMDQLQNETTDNYTLFIYWYVCTNYVGILPAKIFLPFFNRGVNVTRLATLLIPIVISAILLVIPLIGTTLCIYRYKHKWFETNTVSRNPYKLVFRVIKFAKEHSHPIRRSAFTYCEDELPSRLDLGKEKYGGPFTTEQVEDVKAFLGILLILTTTGPMLMADIAANGMIPYFAFHLDVTADSVMNKTGVDYYLQAIFIYCNTLTPLFIVIFILVHIFLLRQCIKIYYGPNMLKRVGIGMVFILLSCLCDLIIDTVEHLKHPEVERCFLKDVYFYESPFNFNIYTLVIPSILNAFGYTLFYTAVFEFICAQSPQAMKGLTIGAFFALKGVSQLLGILLMFAPFTQWKIDWSFPSCGFVYYLLNILIALLGIIAYSCVAKRYQYRQRDEPDNIYRYAEEYYAKAQDSDEEL